MGSAASIGREPDAVAKETVFDGLGQRDADKIEDGLSKSTSPPFVYEVMSIRRGCKRFVLTDGEQECTMFEFAVASGLVEGVDRMLKVCVLSLFCQVHTKQCRLIVLISYSG